MFHVKLQHAAKIDRRQEIAVHDDERLLWTLRQQAQSAGGAKLLAFLQVVDGDAPARAVAEMLAHHLGLVVNGKKESLKSLPDEILEDDLEERLAAHRQHGLGTILGEGPEALAEAARHQHHPIVVVGPLDDIAHELEADDAADII